MKPSRDQILEDVLTLLQSLARDWEFDGPLNAETRLFNDLAFESLDLVVLGAAVQEHFRRTFPFPEFFAQVGQRDVRDITVGEWVDFLDTHMADEPAGTVAALGGEA